MPWIQYPMFIPTVQRREIVGRKLVEEVTRCWIQCWMNQKSRQDATYHFKLVASMLVAIYKTFCFQNWFSNVQKGFNKSFSPSVWKVLSTSKRHMVSEVYSYSAIIFCLYKQVVWFGRCSTCCVTAVVMIHWCDTLISRHSLCH